MHPKTKFAARATLHGLTEVQGSVYLWTFTYPQVLGEQHIVAMEIWRSFLKRVQRQKYFTRGCRVVELHKNGAIHIHAVIPDWISVIRVRNDWKAVGGGRLNVKSIASERALYIAKYLSKGDKSQYVKGLRRWAVWGDWRNIRVRAKDVQFDTLLTRAYRWLKEKNNKLARDMGVAPMDNKQHWRVFSVSVNQWVLEYQQQEQEKEYLAEQNAIAEKVENLTIGENLI